MITFNKNRFKVQIWRKICKIFILYKDFYYNVYLLALTLDNAIKWDFLKKRYYVTVFNSDALKY